MTPHPTREALDLLAELLKASTPGPLSVRDDNDDPHRGHLWVAENEAFHTGGDDDAPLQIAILYGSKADAELVALALNALPALLAMAADAEADAARLDYIERTFSGMTNRERYLPVQMIWGKGCNGRTLREACDKYMAPDTARQGAARGEGDE
jgi:hypothetical protein